jgi:hypothetical protein
MHARDAFPKARLQFIHLGDLVDRGQDSCGVISYLMAFEARMRPRPITLRGNHEQMMIDAHAAGDRAGFATQRNGPAPLRGHAKNVFVAHVPGGAAG